MSLSDREERLLRAAPKSVPNLVEFLTDYLQWPLPAHMEPEDVALIDWRLDDLHLDADQVAKLNRVSQLPKFVDAQPFGVFVLEFESGRLPVGAIRRVVHQLVAKKRTQAHVSHQQWALEDLLFFCQSHDGQADLHVVAFREVAGKPVMKVISWSTDSTDNRLEVIASHNLAKLVWPTGQSNAAALALRDTLLTAFTAEYRQGVKSADLLAKKMAEVARFVRDEVSTLYEVETYDGPLRELFAEVRSRLDSDLTPAKFADMYAQTMVYGLLTARITHPEDFLPGQVTQVLKFENPFLDALYSRFRAGGEQAVDLDEFGLGDLSELLAETDVDELLADFGVGEHRDDPVVFFYEVFLQEYDPEERKRLGAYYTPIPVVKFMVSAVDHLLQTRFGLSNGISDDTTWAEFYKRQNIALPNGVDPDGRVVQMIDPATGTGTYLLEWIRLALARPKEVKTPSSLPRPLDSFDAFEISLSSYSVAQLKVLLEIPAEFRSNWRPPIRLTDTLQGMKSQDLFGTDPLSEEGRKANETKFNKTHSVVIGNPPYLRADRFSGLGGWVVDPEDGSESLFEDVLKPARENTAFSHLRSLSNLYVFFWRWAIWKAFEQNPTGYGVVSFITASSWLRGPGFMGLRKLAREKASEIFIVDLGGDGLGARKDENVFPIQIPVAIVFLIRAGEVNPESNTKCRVNYFNVAGTREEKLSYLRSMDFETTDWSEGPTEPMSSFVPTSVSSEYDAFPLLADIFPWQQPGCIHARTWPVSPSSDVLLKRWKAFVSIQSPEERAQAFVTAKTGRNIFTKVANYPRLVDLTEDSEAPKLRRYAYRAFDRQYTFDDVRFAKTESPSLWQTCTGDQTYMVAGMTIQIGDGPAATCSTDVPDFQYFRGSFGGKDVIPLYRDDAGTPNVHPELLEHLRDKFQGEYSDLAYASKALFCYVYGILAGADFSSRFRSELEVPGPRVPITLDKALFTKMAKHGEYLLFHQTFGQRVLLGTESLLPAKPVGAWIVIPRNAPSDVSQIDYSPEDSSLIVGEGIFQGLRPEIWDFEVSGMKILKKWLGYRTQRGTGRAATSSTNLDKIRPVKWEKEWTDEFEQLVSLVAVSIEAKTIGEQLLDEILENETFSSEQLSPPPNALRKPPKAKSAQESLF
jgi:hypothetical protein